ncbi:protein inturned-like [Amphiura filiformis]|uniref:protein inturned-like n=1 Tax=Amphiura filiformis TaxID=82378 RepID=UPI003B2192CB
MASNHRLWNPPEEGSHGDHDAKYQNTPRIIVQGDGDVVDRPTGDHQQRYDSDSPVSWVSSLTLSDGIEPVWSGEVQQDTGELFYIEPAQDQSPASTTSGQQNAPQSNGSKKKKKSPLPMPKLMRKKKEQIVDNTLDQFKRTSLKRTSFLTKTGSIKEVCLRLHKNNNAGVSRTSKLECWLGIIGAGIPLVSSPVVANGNREHQNGGPVKHEGILVKGLLPSGVAMKSGDIDIGDCIIGINGMRVFLHTIDQVLDSIPNGTMVKVQVQRLSYDSVDKYIVLPQKCPLNGTLVRSITGQLGNEVVDPLKDVPHIVLYLTLVTDDSDDAKEVLFQYPETQVASKLSSVHGLYITLGDMLQNITNSRIQSSSIILGDELVHLGYHKFGSELLVVAVPGSQVAVFQLICIVNNIVRLMCFMYKTLDSAFLDERNHPRLHHLFGLLFQRLLLTENLQSIKTNSNAFQEGLPGVRWLDLPEEVKVHIDSSLNELESADFADMSDEHYDDRRPYVILGSSLFYKGYVIANHLPNEDLQDIAIYCLNYSLMVLCAEQPLGQLVIWREVFPTRRRSTTMTAPIPGYVEPQGRCFLLIVGIRHSLLCVLLETGGCATHIEGKPPPDPFYVDQVRATLLHLETLNVPNTCQNRLQCPPIPALSSADWFFPSRRNTSDSGAPPLPIQTPPMLSKLHSQSPLRGRRLFPTDPSLRRRSASPSSVSQRNLRSASPKRASIGGTSIGGTSIGSKGDSDNESENSPFNSRPNSVASSPALGRKDSDLSTASGGSSELYKVSRNQRLIPDPYSMLQPGFREADACYTATKLTAGSDNILFHYVDLDITQGVLATPTHSHINLLQGGVHNKLIHNFHRCCIHIRQILHQSQMKPKQEQCSTRPRRTSGLGRVREHGVMFKCNPENLNPDKKNPPSMNYWVVGRTVNEPHPRELYVCYHESAPQNVIQLAFKLSYGAGL